jgi:hypothetical protein
MKDPIFAWGCFFILLVGFVSALYNLDKSEKELKEAKTSVKIIDETHASLPKTNDYVIKFSGDKYEAEQTNADIELHGGSPSFNKGFKISVPSEFRFSGTEIKLNMRGDNNGPKHYILAQLYKNGKLIYEQDNETLFKEITLLDLNIGRQE